MEELITVIIPAYNEEPIVKKLVLDTLHVMHSFAKDYEIIVIDDGSTDLTCKEVLSIKNDHVRLIRNEKNMGKTRTMLRGFGLARGDIISFIDADYQYDPQDLVTLIRTLKEGYDIATGHRKRRQDSLYRKIMSWSFNAFNEHLFGIRVKDVNCGLKVFTKSACKNIHIKYLNAKWFIDTELLARCYDKNIRIGESEVRHYQRTEGRSKVNCLMLARETIFYGILLKKDLVLQRIFSSRRQKQE